MTPIVACDVNVGLFVVVLVCAGREQYPKVKQDCITAYLSVFRPRVITIR